MEFFKRILGFDEKTLAREEQRLSQRFTISPLAPLSARLQVPESITQLRCEISPLWVPVSTSILSSICTKV